MSSAEGQQHLYRWAKLLQQPCTPINHACEGGWAGAENCETTIFVPLSPSAKAAPLPPQQSHGTQGVCMHTVTPFQWRRS